MYEMHSVWFNSYLEINSFLRFDSASTNQWGNMANIFLFPVFICITVNVNVNIAILMNNVDYGTYQQLESLILNMNATINDQAIKLQQSKYICKVNEYCISGIFRVGKCWRKCRLEGVLNFHWVLIMLFQGLSIKMYGRFIFRCCFF